MKIIETNILYNGLTINDHQSRVIEVPSWEEYCNLFIGYDGRATGGDYRDVYNQLTGGCIIPKGVTIVDLIIDDFHLTCNMKRHGGLQYKLAYVIEK